jgi:hypothetical protein
MWSDGRWNKLAAHGCWGNVLLVIWITLKLLQRRFCDGEMIQTGENGFHYVDEAAPPALMRVALKYFEENYQ